MTLEQKLKAVLEAGQTKKCWTVIPDNDRTGKQKSQTVQTKGLYFKIYIEEEQIHTCPADLREGSLKALALDVIPFDELLHTASCKIVDTPLAIVKVLYQKGITNPKALQQASAVLARMKYLKSTNAQEETNLHRTANQIIKARIERNLEPLKDLGYVFAPSPNLTEAVGRREEYPKQITVTVEGRITFQHTCNLQQYKALLDALAPPTTATA